VPGTRVMNEKTREAIDRIVESAPPLSDEKKNELARLLGAPLDGN
jgi:hypothetical protein